MKCVCPKTSIYTVDALQCFENMGQIKKIMFQRAGFQFVAGVNDFDLEASYTPLFAFATNDDTKMVITPTVSDFQIPPSTEITETIDNELKVVDGSEVRVTAQMRKWPAYIVRQVRDTLMCEPDIVAYFINKDNQLIGKRVVESPETVEGFPIKPESGFAADLGGDSKTTVASGPLSFSFEFGWRDDIIIKDPESGFFPLRDLKSATS